MKKVVLAYSGGLDTSVLIKLVKEKYNADVIAVTIGLGQQEDLEVIRQKALYIGASEALVIDAQQEFADQYLVSAVQTNALYEGVYPLATALARPLIVDKLAECARNCNASAIAHGCTGKGNDQVRFETGLAYLVPEMKVLAPVRELSLSRDYEVEYARLHNIPVQESLNIYSIDENLWGRSVECGPLEDPECEPPAQAFAWTQAPLDAPNYAAYLEIGFEQGIPTTLNGKRLGFVDLINELNRVGGVHGVGRIDHIESRLVGIKSREVYEAPAAVILIKAHHDLEKLVLTKDVLHFKPMLENTFAELVYNGLWFSPLRCAITAFIQATQEYVTGVVKIKLYKGSVYVVGRSAEKGLYVKNLATYDKYDEFESPAAQGFIHIWSLPYKVQSLVQQSKMQGGFATEELSCAKKEAE